MGMLKKIFWGLLSTTMLVGYKNNEFADREMQFVVVESVTSQKPAINLQSRQNCLQDINLDAELMIFGYLLCAKEFYKIVRDFVVYKRWLKHLSYDEFMVNFAHLVVIERQITQIQDLLHTATHGTFPEQLSSRISLARSSLPYPYDQIVNECTMKYYKINFDEQGRLVWKENDMAEESFKKFYKKVPQDFRALARSAKIKLKTVKNDSVLQIIGKTENEYNQTLLDMIVAGIDENFPLLKKLCRNYYDSLIEKLYQYYLDQNFKKYPTGAVNEVAFFTELYCKEMLSWFCVDGSCSDFVRNKIYELLAQENVLDLSSMSDYRFLLLRKFLDVASDAIEMQEELFLPCGILKKYKNHAWVKNGLDGMSLHDIALRKAINFALVISEKELDLVTQQICKRMIQYILSACKAKNNEQFELCKNKIVVLYEALSYKRYEQNILEI